MTLKVCVVGCGAVARRAHIPIFQSIPDVQVASVVDTDEDLARRVSKEFGIKEYYSDYKQALNDEEVKLVSICTPSFTHGEIATEAAKMGKHVLVEKPLAMDLEEGKTIIRTARESGVKLCVVFNYRMAPSVQCIHQKIRQRDIGRVVSMIGISHTPFPASWTRSSWLYHFGGALDDFGPHIIDILLWLNPSKLESVSALGGDFTNEFGFISHIQVGMKFQDTSVSVADISWLSDSFIVNVDVHGTAGRLLCDVRSDYEFETHGQIVSPLDELASTTRKSLKMTKSILSGKYFRGGLQYHQRIIEEYVELIKTGVGEPPVSGEEALLVTAVSAAAKQSLRTGKIVLIDDIL